MGTDLTNRNRKESVLYWEPDGDDGEGHRLFTSASPETILVRWEDKNELFIDTEGKEQRSVAKVLIATRDLVNGGYLFRGDADDVAPSEDVDDPQTIEGAFEIKRFDKIPRLKNAGFNRRAFL